MRSIVVVTGCCFALSVGLAGAGEKKNISYVNLQPKANQTLTQPFHSGREGNNLAKLATGEQTFEGVKFKVEEGLLQLGSTRLKDKPQKIEGIRVGKTVAKLHILHATGYGSYGSEGDPQFVADDTKIGEFKVYYEDKSTQTIPIVYGKDIRDWWNWDKSKKVTRGKVAWTGTNEYAKRNDVKIRLYLTTWKNPKPEKKLTHIDYVSTGNTVAAPFCVAMTVEGARRA